jgi:alkyldihydroxyacetonephosphate synthase
VNLNDDALDRVVHCYGKGLRDLVRIRRGDLGRVPDLVVYPGSEDEVVRIVRVALSADAVLIPFGGGTNISGSLEAPRVENRPVLSIDMGRMKGVVEIDEVARLHHVSPCALLSFWRLPLLHIRIPALGGITVARRIRCREARHPASVH